MDGAAILFTLAIAGVFSIVLFSLKGLLDQLPDVIDSAGRARDAWLRFRKPPLPPADDEEPPAAA
ncbi:hypothetical protein ACFRMN_07235 [Streptomyces sp. NPDC056835]|uniref:hypothetical protein n=1 Tax=Streptomyces sp. NPDC056835 TaxID=3345956 RepID=UPI0036A0E181